MPSLILASQSPQRALLLESLGRPFEVSPADLDEAAFPVTDQWQRAEALARAKVEVVVERFPEAAVLGADTYVVLGERVLEKPGSIAEAHEMLTDQSGQDIIAVCGVALWQPGQGMRSQTVKVGARFRSLLPTEIEQYVTRNPVTTWSGAFSALYPAGIALIAEIHGSLSAFNGLPLEVVGEWLTDV